MKRKPYDQRSDLEKLRAQWTKATGLLRSKNQWSAAFLRAVIAVEIAANFAIRREFESKSRFADRFVDRILIWANGINGKFDHLLKPLHHGRRTASTIASLYVDVQQINRKRNAIMHSGEFMDEEEARLLVEKIRRVIETLVGIYEPDFELKDKSR
jgi:hypothetical protein